MYNRICIVGGSGSGKSTLANIKRKYIIKSTSNIRFYLTFEVFFYFL